MRKAMDENLEGKVEQVGEKPALVIEYDPPTQGFQFRLHTAIPQIPLLGIIEIVKAQLIAMQARAQQQQANQGIVLAQQAPAPPNGGQHRRF
jgi:hypothetical protein